MRNEIKLKPPYPSTGQADEVLDIFRRISPKKIDSKFIAENRIATAPNASTVVNFVKWLGITDSENNVKDEVANKLRLIGEERNRFINELIKISYKDVIEGVNLQAARREDLINFFINNYNFGAAQAKNASILFLHLCEKYGITLSDELKKKTHFTSTINNKISKKPQTKAKKSISNNQSENKPFEIKEGIIVLSIKGNGLDKQIEATSAKELERLYKGKFKSFIEAAKHLFPDEEKETSEDVTDKLD